MAVLTFIMPFFASAEQPPVQDEAEAAVAQDINTVKLEAKATAQKDASRDVSAALWMGVGGLTVATACIGGYGGLRIGRTIDDSSSGGFFGYGPNDTQAYAMLVGCTVGYLVPFISTYFYPSIPLPTRLVGKSPDYVEFYIDAYKKKVRSLRTRWAAAGSATGCGLMIIGGLIFID